MWERFKNISEEQKAKLWVMDFTVSELKEILNETVMSDIDREIAELRFLKLLSIEKIAERLQYDKRTISSRIKSIQERIEKTIKNLI